MAKQQNQKYPTEQFASLEKDDGASYLVFHNSVEELLEYKDVDSGDVIEVPVYKLDKVIKVKKEAVYKVVE